MARFFESRDDLVDSLESQIAALRKEVAGMRRTLGKRGAKAYDSASDSASDLYEELSERWTQALPHIRHGARAAERRARENPAATAAVGIAVVGLLALLLVRR